MKYTNYIWDYDGTLMDTYPAMAEAMRQSLKARDINMPADEIEAIMRVSMGDARRHYQAKLGLDDAFFDQFAVDRIEYERLHARPFEGMVDVCRHIAESGGRNLLFTHRGPSALMFLEAFGVKEYFSGYVTSETPVARKPSPEGIDYLMRQHNLAPDDTVMVGDRRIDILSGVNAGVHTCFFSPLGETCDVAEYNVTGFGDLLETIVIG